MIPAGYMAKRVCLRPGWLNAAEVTDIYSVSGCVSEYFADYVNYWKHNGYWLFDSPEIIRSIARENSIELGGKALFYYEVYELEFNGEAWHRYEADSSRATNVVPPVGKQLEGFDIVTFWAGASPECSPLSCNSLAGELAANEHCLLTTFEQAETALKNGSFKNSEPGPFRIFSVYSVDWLPLAAEELP